MKKKKDFDCFASLTFIHSNDFVTLCGQSPHYVTLILPMSRPLFAFTSIMMTMHFVKGTVNIYVVLNCKFHIPWTYFYTLLMSPSYIPVTHFITKIV